MKKEKQKKSFYARLPRFLQEIGISLYNIRAYKKRYGGSYSSLLKKFAEGSELTLAELKSIQAKRYKEIITYARMHSPFYKSLQANLSTNIVDISQLPIINKETLRENINDIYTIDKNDGIVSKTGGTTGKSLVVLYTHEDMQERFAMLDAFRSQFGYKLGKKTAWFSGKALLNENDIKKHRFWRTDHWHKVRYYSTFHIKNDYLKYYVEDLIRFAPEYMVGFPSTILEIAKYGLKHGYIFPKNTVKAVFPTSETITDEMRDVIGAFFHTKLYDQYASSEGAPFIVECKEGNLHMDLRSGVFEVLDENDKPCKSGRLVLTSFTTHGTPLIRYDIGDSLELMPEDHKCTCGNNNPLVKRILGRIDDYVYSPEVGKINLVNISNTTKGANGISRFQVIQEELHAIRILLVRDGDYSKKDEALFLQNWKDRVGSRMKIDIEYVEKIEVAKSGKYRIVINKIKNLISND